MLTRRFFPVLLFLASLAAPPLSVRAADAPFKAKAQHVVLCAWDGMRPDFITPENTPNLHALSQRGTFFNRNHSFYVTTTEVNGTVLATGVFPRRSGILANREYRPGIDLMHAVATEDRKTIRIGDALMDGHYLGVMTVAEIVQQAGLSTAVAATKGIGLLHDRSVDRAGKSPTVCFGRTYPEDFLKTIEKTLGKFPDFQKSILDDLSDARPNTAQNLWTTRALIGGLGLGIFIVGWILQIAQFPAKAEAGLAQVGFHDAFPDTDALIFQHDQGVEELLVVKKPPTADLTYDLTPPPGWHLQRIQGPKPFVEVRDERDVARLRFRSHRLRELERI